MSYDTGTRLAALASKHDLSERQFSRHLRAMAFIQTRTQYKVGMAACDMLRVCGGGGIVTDVMQADETKQRLLIQFNGACSGQNISAPHVMVSLRTLSFTLDNKQYGLPWITAPTPCISTTAGTLAHVFEELSYPESAPTAISDDWWSRFQSTAKTRCVSGA